MKRLIIGLAATLAMTVSSFAMDAKPAVVYDKGGKNDGSFNQAAYNGAELFKKETGTAYRDFEVTDDAQREQAMRRFARDGYNPVVVIGFSQAAALEKVAAEFPDTKFAIVDMVVDKPNVRSVVFKEQEGSYLVGVMAAQASKSGTVGFIGGMDIPLIRKFACGYVGGVKSIKADAKILQNMTGTTGAAWNDPTKGGELARAQMDQGAEVIYHAAGGTGFGVLQAVADAGKLGIGVDSNQNHLHPGKVLTSMLKRVDIAVYNAFKDVADDKWTSGFSALGLKEGGVDVAMDEHNKPLVDADMMKALESAKADIISGKVIVHDYMSDNKCPY
ncbi:MAG: BMP family ABC transporter substrate-binding protein [Rhizobiales bacterium]|nr:BMP family ABC transporter substrate-binding protein [Hyphomicrobiales bacterium]